MNFTKRNHYNPCFWTALWNDEYYQLARHEGTQPKTAREQTVHALSVKSQKLLATTVERVHYDKNLGIAEITRDAATEFVRRYNPAQYENFLLEHAEASYPVFIDFEEILTKLEELPPYQILLKVALSGRIENVAEKANIGAFVVLQCLRSHAIMNSMIDWSKELGNSKFEYFVNLRWMLSDTQYLFSLVSPIVCCQWTLFTDPPEMFPLCDSPVLVGPESIMVALSPWLLLEVEPNIKAEEVLLPFYRKISATKYDEFRRRTIGNTFREIIGNRNALERWSNSDEFRSRTTLMKDIKNYNAMVLKSGEREVWQLNAYGNRT